MREIDVSRITSEIAEMCIEANLELSADMQEAMDHARTAETNPLAKQVLEQLKENATLAADSKVPICQDTGMAVVFLSVGQEVHFVGGDLMTAINEGVRRGYEEGFLRKSVVADPLIRENTKDNTPAVVHYAIVPGDEVAITVAPKGFGSENMSRQFMLKPSDGIEGVKEKILESIEQAGPNACPPLVVGVGLGGTFEKSAIMAKEALLIPVGRRSEKKHIAEMEEELIERANALGIGPGGLGGDATVLDIHIKTYPTHIAGLPLAINLCCHVNRHVRRVV